MNKAEFKAIKMIAEKLNWESVNFSTIKQMVRNQQSLELDTVGECDDDEETLLSMALWDAERIFSTLLVYDYQSLCDYNQNFKGLKFLEDMGLGSYTDIGVMMAYAEQNAELLAPKYEAEDSFALMASEYNDADWHDFYNYGVYMGWF